MSKLRRILCISVLLLIALLAIPASMGQGQSWCGVQTLYFQHNASTTPAGYEELINYPSGNAEVEETVSVINTGGPVLIDNYIMPEHSLTETIMLLEGLRRYRFYAYVDSNVGTTRLNFTAFRRFDNGTEHNFYTVMSEDINDLAVTEYNLNYVSQVHLNINPNDRLGIRISANTTHSAPIIVHGIYQGAIHASHFESGYFECGNWQYDTIQETPMSPVAPGLAIALVMFLVAMRKKE
jgi:hypothetical protein